MQFGKKQYNLKKERYEVIIPKNITLTDFVLNAKYSDEISYTNWDNIFIDIEFGLIVLWWRADGT